MATPAEPPKAEFGAPLRLGNDDNGLAYHVFNPEGTESVLFLHGAGTGAPEWDIVIPHFSKEYHLLVPDIPLHNRSANIPLKDTAKDTGDILSDLIKSEAKEGKAHVVGLSLGAHIGRRLGVQSPDVVKSCFLSGYNDVNFNWMPLKTYLPHLIYAVEYVGTKIPKSWVDGIEHTSNITTPHTLEHFKKIWGLITDEDLKDKSWEARTLFIAAAKGGLIPTDDSIKDAKDLANLGQKENKETTAVLNKNMRHAWNRQEPKIFAEAAMCWIDGRPLPDGFEPI